MKSVTVCNKADLSEVIVLQVMHTEGYLSSCRGIVPLFEAESFICVYVQDAEWERRDGKP